MLYLSVRHGHPLAMKAKCCRNSAFSHKMGEFNRTGRERQVEEVHVAGRVEMMTPVAMIRDDIKIIILIGEIRKLLIVIRVVYG